MVELVTYCGQLVFDDMIDITHLSLSLSVSLSLSLSLSPCLCLFLSLCVILTVVLSEHYWPVIVMLRCYTIGQCWIIVSLALLKAHLYNHHYSYLVYFAFQCFDLILE